MDSAGHGDSRVSRLVLALGLAGFVLVSLLTWPYALSFGDEVGYLGQSQLLMVGRIAPSLDSPGVYFKGPDGAWLSQYPLFVPLLLIPFLSVEPRAIFAIGLFASVAMALLASKALRRLGAEPSLGLLFLIHPTFVLIARTAMPDIWLAAAALAGWWFGSMGRRALAAVLMAVIVLLKPTGIAIAAALVAGEALGAWKERTSLGGIARRVAPSVAGIAAGWIVVAALNWIQWRHVRYSYSNTYQLMTYASFAPRYLRTSGVTYLLSIALVPPGLFLGAWGLWRRRLYGPLFVVAGLLAMMSVYFFVDSGRSWPETLIMAQRLVLPASAFLLLGFCVVLSEALGRLRLQGPARPILALLAPAVALAIGLQHRGWQRSGHEALLRAERIAAEKHADVLGSSQSALKASLMHRGRVTIPSVNGDHPPVVLCNLLGASYRQTYTTSCDLAGYEVREADESFRILVAR